MRERERACEKGRTLCSVPPIHPSYSSNHHLISISLPSLCPLEHVLQIHPGRLQQGRIAHDLLGCRLDSDRRFRGVQPGEGRPGGPEAEEAVRMGREVETMRRESSGRISSFPRLSHFYILTRSPGRPPAGPGLGVRPECAPPSRRRCPGCGVGRSRAAFWSRSVFFFLLRYHSTLATLLPRLSSHIKTAQNSAPAPPPTPLPSPPTRPPGARAR